MSNERLEVLGGLPLFEPLSPDERERLAAGCRMRAFARGAALFREGERADGMHIVLRGVVKVVRFAPDGREMVLHLVRKGNTIVWVGNEHYGEDGYTFEFQLGA